MHFYFAFCPGYRYKTPRAAYAKKRTVKIIVTPLPAGLSSELLALACRWPQGVGVEVIRKNEPSFSAESVMPFWHAFNSRNLHL
ncbi:hypothetical protein [Trabulsiella odontotermitis]|uniref:hypothetical protein n=1 Tax=Trabulsiella odontotermitis TaxID=379893 RepID=UPI0011CF0DD6|nr:hypothetical protein [Trabulsiella odontotermitis]